MSVEHEFYYAHNGSYCMIRPEAEEEGDDIVSTSMS